MTIAIRFTCWWTGLLGMQPVCWERAIGWLH